MNRELKILMLEDLADDAELIKWQLKRNKISFRDQRVDTEQEFVDAVEEFKPDVILSDHSLPQFNSIAALKIAKDKLPNVPFILVTGSVSEEFAVACMKSGADDYILKSNLARLPASIEASLEKYKLTEENITIKKLNAEIAEKNRELDYLNQEKDRLMSIVSHDLQNQIGAIAIIVDIMKGRVSGINDKSNLQIRRLDRSVNNMRVLLSDVLTINRIQHGIINPMYNLVEPGKLVNEVVDRYEDTAAKKKIKLKYKNKCKDMYFSTDVSYFSIIADNLISNALKYSPVGKSVWVELVKRNKKYVLEVKDEGLGIPAHDIPKLYGRFQKLSPRPTGNEPSNGLGLSIVKDLVTALKGTIECESAVNKGTTFSVTF